MLLLGGGARSWLPGKQLWSDGIAYLLRYDAGRFMEKTELLLSLYIHDRTTAGGEFASVVR